VIAPPAAPREVYAEDLTPGRVLELGSYTMTESEIVDFASHWDPQFFHTDPERARREGRLGGLIASGLHTLAVFQRLSILARTECWHVIGGAGLDDVAFLSPVRPGDVLSGRSVVADLVLQPERQRGLVTLAGGLTNQDGTSVLRLTMSAYLAARPA
jgi:acyl dehydratase